MITTTTSDLARFAMPADEVLFASYLDPDDAETDEGSPKVPSLGMIHENGSQRRRWRCPWHYPLDWHSKWLEEWNRTFLIVSAAGLLIDPLFFYSLSISSESLCLFVDGWFAITVTILRCMTDAVHAFNMRVRLNTTHRMRKLNVSEEEGKPSSCICLDGAAIDYLKSKTGFFFDLFIILPIPLTVQWVAAPILISNGKTSTVTNVFLITFLIQYLLKIYHSLCFTRRTQNLYGCIFGTISWAIALNLTAYFIASHAIGACWYLLGIQRAVKCLNVQCALTKGCKLRTIGCAASIKYDTAASIGRGNRLARSNYSSLARTTCLDNYDSFDYGAYKWTVLLITNQNRFERILLPIFWGLMNLTTFGGGLQSTTECLEILFNIVVVTAGLLLVTMLIGNIKVFLHSKTSKKQALHLKMRSVEWWMKRRQLPMGIRRMVRQYQRQRWAAMRGVDECEMIQNLPDGLRRDIKYHLCLDLVRQVPFFQHMDEVVLENICDRVKSQIFPKGETIGREGDPVQRMLFIVRGHLQSSQVLREGIKSQCMLGPGNFTGDELLSWCVRRPFVERLPPSSSTLVTLETTEAFSLEASDVKFVVQNFRHTFVNEQVKRSARYYSPGWRTWAAVAIQLAWRRYKHKLTLTSLSLSFKWPRRPATTWCSSPGEEKLRHYTAMLTSPKPNQDDLL